MVFSKKKIPVIEQFIAQVQKYPAVWNKGSKAYKDVYLKANVWNSILNNLRSIFEQTELISNEMNSLEDLRKQWKSLKDVYQREKKKLSPPSGSGADALPKVSWPFYHQVKAYKVFKRCYSNNFSYLSLNLLNCCIKIGYKILQNHALKCKSIALRFV